MRSSNATDSRVLLLAEERQALLVRLALAAAARQRIDVQYYIWAGDGVGIAVIKQLLLAAQRGVHVRLLVDDIHFIGYDRRVLALNAYDNVEIRAFNPFRYRFRYSPVRSIAEVLSGASRLNHRMHNKVFAVDGNAAIVGGRNLSNEYFGAHPEFNFRDIDLLVEGPAVAQIDRSFDEFWNSRWSIPLQELHKHRIKPLVMSDLLADLSAWDLRVFERVDALPIEGALVALADSMHVCAVEVLADTPSKLEPSGDYVSPVRQKLFALTAHAESQILVENGYFVPSGDGVVRLAQQVERGVEVVVVTNSLASNDTGLSHAGYKRYRRALLRCGVKLFELRVDAQLGQDFELCEAEQTATGLHSKVATLDRRIAFVGSYNLDPRSAFINTEIGVVVHSEALAEQLSDEILQVAGSLNSWGLKLTARGTLSWQHASQHRAREPRAKWSKTLIALVFSWLPIEKHL
ncbi:MAG: phospholipase D family protein [bacterium]